MPEPQTQIDNLSTLLRDAVVLQESGQPDVSFEVDYAAQELWSEIDATMISQALTNLLKNAGEAIETYKEKESLQDHKGKVRVTSSMEEEYAVIRIADNGIGLPEDRSRLFEPYVTTREKGTGLGLPIVKKIIEEHGGTLSLEHAPPFEPGARAGAMAVIRLPLTESDAEMRLNQRKAV